MPFESPKSAKLRLRLCSAPQASSWIFFDRKRVKGKDEGEERGKGGREGRKERDVGGIVSEIRRLIG